MHTHDGRHQLTIDLERDGVDLVRTYSTPAYPKLVSHRVPFDAVGRGYQAGGATGLRALHGVLARGDRVELDQDLRGAQLARAGEALFAALFGDEPAWSPVLREVFQQHPPRAQPEPTRGPLRVRIRAGDDLLQGLPWRAATWKALLLVDFGWTFEVCAGDAPRGQTDLHAPGTILVVAPDFVSMKSLGTMAHVRALGELFESVAAGRGASPHFRIVRTRAALVDAVRLMTPDILYFYGHGSGSGDHLEIHLGDAGGPRDPVSVQDLARILRDASPKVVVLNGCATGQAGWHSAGWQLLPHVKLVVSNATTAWSEESGRLVLQWFARWFREEDDPVIAFHQLGKETSTHGFDWLTPIVHTRYDVWKTTSALSFAPRFPEDWLDREHVRSIVQGYVSDLCGDPQRRAMAAIACAAPGNRLDRVSDQIMARIEREIGDRVHVHKLTLRFPERRAPKTLADDLTSSFKSQLGREPAEEMDLVLRAVRDARARRRGSATTVLWFDWGIFDPAGRHQPPLADAEIYAWLDFVRDRIASKCPGDMRVVAMLELEIEPARLDAMAKGLSLLEAHQRYLTPAFRFRKIPRIDDIELIELIDYLRHAGCGEGLVLELGNLIYTKTGGRYEETVALLKKGATSWHTLHEELGGQSALPALSGS